MKAIQINEPCQENWNDMQETQRGAFCQRCTVDVYDFSRMKLQEIKIVLKENEGKHLCGRFEANQLAELNQEFEAWKLNQPKSFQSRFVFALLLVFGLSLFSCSEEDISQIAALNAIELKSALNQPEKAIADKLFWSQDSIIVNEMIHPKQTDLEPEKHMIMGEMYYQEEAIDSVVTAAPYHEMVAGGPMIDPSYYAYLNTPQETVVVKSDSETPSIPLVIVSFETKIYPNPTKDQAVFSIFTHHHAQFQIEVYSMSGQKVTELHNGDLGAGRHEFNIDMTDLEAGTYLITVLSELQRESIKLIKVD